MKANNGTGNIEARDEWQTPQKLWDELNEQYKFDFDCCTNGRNTKCRSWSSNFEMWVSAGIKHICWMNPPFTKAKEMFKHFFKVVDQGVAIYRCDNLESVLWQEIILPNCSWVFIPKGRVSYEGMDGKGSRFPSALIGVGLPPPKLNNGYLLTT